MMENNEWIYLETYAQAELMVVKPLLEEAEIEYLEKTCQEGEILKLYTTSAGPLGAEIWVRPEDEERVKKLLDEIE